MQRIAVLLMLGFCACGGYRGGSKATFPTFAAASSPAGGAATGGTTAGPTTEVVVPELPQQLVVEGSIQLSVSEIKDLVPALRAHVEQLGGLVVEEEVSGLDSYWQAHVKLRVPPQQLEAVVTWLASRGDITDKQIRSSDVAKTLFDQELALKNAQLTSERLEALLRQGGLTMADVLAVERELTRLRGETEAIKGQAAFLKDRVALATLDVGMTRKSGTVRIAQAKAYPGGRVSALILLDPEGRARTRLGGGFAVHTIFRAATLELELYQRKDDGEADGAGAEESMAVIATVGGAMYSDFLGRGERKLGNPFLGLRTGYGYLDSHRWVVQAEAGVELIKTERFMLDASVRLSGLIGEDVDAAAIVGGSAVVAF
jgi:Domain of unknown function (DUF4349)